MRGARAFDESKQNIYVRKEGRREGRLCDIVGVFFACFIFGLFCGEGRKTSLYQAQRHTCDKRERNTIGQKAIEVEVEGVAMKWKWKVWLSF